MLKYFALASGLSFLFTLSAEEKVKFNKDIRPILSDKCFACHGPDAHDIKGKLQLHTATHATEERHYTTKSGKKRRRDAAIIPGDIESSLVWERIISDDEDEVMPPIDSHKPLSKEEKLLIKRWIEQGAEYEEHWSYSKVQKPKQLSVDACVEGQLKSQGLSLSNEADRRTLIRRLSFDLRGLPPSREEISQFLKDQSPKAYENLVDAFLSSPHYGEKMAAGWLDLVRYGDTSGFHSDVRIDLYPYREYVINAFNSNKSFADFTKEQLAGDLLENPSEEQKIATAYNRLNLMTQEGGAIEEEYLVKSQGDRIRATSVTWLGSTLGCAECHDHKYDPFTAKDYYAFGAFFADVKQVGVYNDLAKKGLAGASFPPVLRVQDEQIKKQISPLYAELHQKRQELKNYLLTERSEELNKLFNSNIIKASFDAKKDIIVKGEQLNYGAIPPKIGGYDVDLQVDQASSYLYVEIFPEAKGSEFWQTGLEISALQLFDDHGEVPLIQARASEANQYSEAENALDLRSGKNWSVNGKSRMNKSVYLIILAKRKFRGQVKFRLAAKGNQGGLFSRMKIQASDYEMDLKEFSALSQGKSDELDKLKVSLSDSIYAKLRKRINYLEVETKRLHNEYPQCLVTETGKPFETRILPRGDYMDKSGEVVLPAIPEFLGKIDKEGRANRLDLANWLSSKENPLTARVFVNRLWQNFFGRAISTISEDLGSQGEPPSHPELLDYLAWEFMDSGWNVKQVVKSIVMSKAYRQVSNVSDEIAQQDPYNYLVNRQSPRRLAAEYIRDNALALSSLLNTQIGGQSFFPYQPDGYYGELYPKRQYIHDKWEQQYRRGLYTHVQRTFLHPMLKNFDSPGREASCSRRSKSNTPLQALNLLNDPTFLEAALHLALRAQGEAPQAESQRLAWLFETVNGRSAKTTELKDLQEYLENEQQYFAQNPESAQTFIESAMLQGDYEVDALATAPWVSVSRVLLNLHESITIY
jgi:hypothetical protein